LFERNFGRIPHLLPVENIGTGDPPAGALSHVRRPRGRMFG
jgi:hypothetical protein